MMFRRLILVMVLALAGAPIARADAPTVTAVLTSSETEVDRPVQLRIKVTGDSEGAPPTDISVDGLEIHFTGQSQLVEGRNFHFSYSFIYSYTILPLKAGTFTIPPQTVKTKSGNLRTEALTLNVSLNGNGTTSSTRGRNGGGSTIDERKLVFADLVVPKTTAYVGELIPVEIRLGFNTRTRARLAEGPSLTAQSFTTQRMPEPQQSVETVNGVQFQVVTFKTAIAAARSGKFEVGPVEAKALVQVPRRAGSRGRSPFDVFGMNDPFNDPFFQDPFAGIPEQRQIDMKSQTVAVEIKPLPPNSPASFSGAVGNFGLTTDVKPKKAQIGDPLTVTAVISGRGNFDRVNSPTIEDDRGWHTYPPSAKFQPDDDVGLSGTKSFEMVLTPNENKTAVPPLLFSYFDPLKERYITLNSEKLPITIEGGAAPVPSAAVASASNTPPTAQPTPAPQADDILYLLTDRPRWVQSFAPVFERPVFWAVQVVPLLALIGFFGWKSRQRRLANREGQQRAAWEEETAELQKKLRRAEDPPDRYFAEALRVVQLKTALARRVPPNTVDAETAVSAFQLDDEKRARVRELFRQSDELRYSGRQNGHGAVNDAMRREVLELIDSLS
ncbi:MAG: BatD family protein [Chthoniobacterales bacterium]